ncbi:MAG: hypothetical protein WAK17_22925 [Candidatus Nitrosopolaris sp.]|jgi:hypothetical protein
MIVKIIKIVCSKCRNLGVTVPADVMRQLNDKRGDVTKSRFVSRALEYYFANTTRPHTGDDKQGGLKMKLLIALV